MWEQLRICRLLLQSLENILTIMFLCLPEQSHYLQYPDWGRCWWWSQIWSSWLDPLLWNMILSWCSEIYQTQCDHHCNSDHHDHHQYYLDMHLLLSFVKLASIQYTHWGSLMQSLQLVWTSQSLSSLLCSSSSSSLSFITVFIFISSRRIMRTRNGH